MEKAIKKISIGKGEIAVKEYAGKRVVTFKDIDNCHGRPEGTAGRNFRTNKQHFMEGTDFFRITPDEFRRTIGEMDKRQQNDTTLVTESGYLMLVKSFTDDLAWDVQRELVNRYFVQESRAGGGNYSGEELAKIVSFTVAETLKHLMPMFRDTETFEPELETAEPHLRRRRRQAGIIEKLPNEIRDRVDEMLLDHFTYKQIQTFLNVYNVRITESSVHRYAKHFFDGTVI